MSSQCYSAPPPIETLLTWVKSGEIAIPEIQRPPMWEAIKFRNLLDLVYETHPVGYLKRVLKGQVQNPHGIWHSDKS